MGQQSSLISEANRLYEMPLTQYRLQERLNQAISIWKRKSPPYEQLIESRMVVNSVDDLQVIYDIFKMRHLHVYLAPTCFLTCECQGIKGCGEYYKGNIYLEWPITTLAMINDIPFIDSLHLFAVAVRGFEILFRKFGYFEVFQDMFHICEFGKLKVWCNSQVYKLGPEAYLLDASGKEQDMLYRIINIIDDNVDKSELLNLKRVLYSKIPANTHFQSFQQANYAFRQVCKQNNWQPPERLRCIAHLSREEIQKLLNYQHETQHHYSQSSNTADNGVRQPVNQQQMNNQGKASFRSPPPLVKVNQSSSQNKQLIKYNNKPPIFRENHNNNRYVGNGQPIHLIVEQHKYIPQSIISNSNGGKVSQNLFISHQQTPQVIRNQSFVQVPHKFDLNVYSRQKSNHNSRENSIQKPIAQLQHQLKGGEQFMPIKWPHNFSNQFVNPNQQHSIQNNSLQNRILVNRVYKHQPIPNSHPPSPFSPSPIHKFPPYISYQKPITKFCQVQSRIIQPINMGRFYNTNNGVEQPKPHAQLESRVTSFRTSNVQPPFLDKCYVNQHTVQSQCQLKAVKQINFTINKDQNQSVRSIPLTPNSQGNGSRVKDQKEVQQDLWKVNRKNNGKKQQAKQTNQQQKIKMSQKKSLNYDKLKLLQRYQSDFTDPFLLEHLSTNDKSTSSISPSQFSNIMFNREMHSDINTWEEHAQNQHEVPVESQMLYSFSQNMKYSEPKKDEVSANCSETQQTVINSQRSGITLRKYEAGIDQEIWKDLLELKKNKNLY